MLWLRLPGSFVFRLAERTFLPLSFHEPPRNTRLPPAMTTLPAAVAEQVTGKLPGCSGITIARRVQFEVAFPPGQAVGVAGHGVDRVVTALQRQPVDLAGEPRRFPSPAALAR